METGEMFPGSPSFRKLLKFLCKKSSPSYQMCKEYMFASVGPSFQWNDVSWRISFDILLNYWPNRYQQDLFIEPKIFDHFPNSVSFKQLIHYGQLIRAGGSMFTEQFFLCLVIVPFQLAFFSTITNTFETSRFIIRQHLRPISYLT